MTTTGLQQQQVTLETLNFDNSFVRDLPADPISEYDKVKGNMPRQVEKAAFSRVLPKMVSAPKLVAYSKECASFLDLPESECERPYFADIFAGNEIPPGSDPFAACYGGHQFGNWAGQLGDGRAISLGEIINKKGERWELQLKGAGPTPYSRGSDGRAVLRSSIREVDDTLLIMLAGVVLVLVVAVPGAPLTVAAAAAAASACSHA
jgi:serine/tyrosine/threonine adenylyltransferase